MGEELDSRTVLSHKQVGINLLQVSLGWKSDDCNNSKLCRKDVSQSTCNCGLYFRKSNNKRKSPTAGENWKDANGRKASVMLDPKVLGIQNRSIQFK